MAGVHRRTHHHRLCFIICVSSVLLLILFSKELSDRRDEERHRRDQDDLLDSTEIPAELIDPAAIDLTPLVNTLINTSQSGSRQLFSLLSVTSYSSLALHKLTLLVYNISNIRSIESNVFRRRFCYCVTNETNDLTDFTAILLDVMGNSTTYLQELFKSASILSVSQRNNSDCIYICVMAGKTGREVPELWEVDSITPLFNQTIVEGPHRGNVSSIRLPVEWNQLPTNLSHEPPSGMSSMLTSRVHSTAHVSPPEWDEAAATTANTTTDKLLETSPQPPTIIPQRQTTTDTPETTIQTTTGGGGTRAGTTASTTTTTEETTSVTILQPITSAGATTTRQVTASPAALTSSTTPSTTEPTTSTPGVSLTRLTFTTQHPTTTGLTTSTDLPTRLSSARLTTAGSTPPERTTGPMSRRTTIPSKTVETEKPDLSGVPELPCPVGSSGSLLLWTCQTPAATTTTIRLPTIISLSLFISLYPSLQHGCPWRRPEVNDVSAAGRTTTTVSAHKLQPCVLELCKFFSQCLCRPFSRKTRMKRYCDDSHLWYEKHTFEVCRRVRRVSFSRNLKQRCLMKMCNKL